jgi:hypothetical protein
MFHVDNVSVGDFGCYGGAYPLGARTPNVDRFASEGLMLTNYAPEAQCTPSRAALMTGRYSARNGCISALPGSGLVAWEVTIADKLKELGYRNACLGKWHCGEDVGRLPTDKGFDYWTGTCYTTNRRVWEHDTEFKDYLKRIRPMAIDMETATIFITGFYNHIPTAALLLVSDQPMVPEGVKTAESDKTVTSNFVQHHLEIGIDSLKQLINNGNTVKHLKF